MEGETTSVTDLDPVSEQLVAGTGGAKRRRVSPGVLVSWGLLVAGLAVAVGIGISGGSNPTDQTVAWLAAVPFALLIVPIWALLAALFRRTSGLSIQHPIVLSAGLVLLWVWAQYLAQFDVFYKLEPTGPLSGVYVARRGIAILLGLIALLSLAAAVFLTRATARGLPAKRVSKARSPYTTEETPDVAPAVADTVLESGEPIYEAQLLLLNLGYEIVQVDGQLDELTRSALKKEQMALGLPPSGNVTMLTLNELRRRANLQPAPSLWQTTQVVLAHIGRSAGDWARLWWRRRYAG